MSAALYRLCKRCDHFAELDGEIGHLDDGEQEFTHEPEPVGRAMTLDEWKQRRPSLFGKYPDGRIGPNSRHHRQLGKTVHNRTRLRELEGNLRCERCGSRKNAMWNGSICGNCVTEAEIALAETTGSRKTA